MHRPTATRTRAVLPGLAAMALAAPLVVATAPSAAAADASEASVTHFVTDGEGGVPIYTNLFLPAEASADSPVPLIMRTHGYGGSGARTIDELSSTATALLEAGYAVVTWDERGFGYSGGEVEVDKPELEGEDASAVLTKTVEDFDEIQRDDSGDPLVGMSGVSYAGGIQSVLATFDDRIDAVAPEISWSDLLHSLYQGDVINIGWGSLLVSAGEAAATEEGLMAPTPPGPQTGGQSDDIRQLFATGIATNQFSEEGKRYLAASSLAPLAGDRGVDDYYGDEAPYAAPALVMNGSVDTLFDPRDGYGVYQAALDAGQDAKFVVFCGGHVSCPDSYSDAGDREHLDELTVAWMDKYVKGEDVDTGAPVEYRTNTDTEFRSDQTFSPQQSSLVTVSGSGDIVSEAAGTPSADPSTFIINAQPSEDGERALTFEAFAATEDEPVDVVGFGEARLKVSGMGDAVHLFVKLVDREAGEVLNVQEDAIRVEDLSDEAQEITVPLTGFAYTLEPGHHLDVQVASESEMHLPARVPAQVTVEADVDVPVLPTRPLAQARQTTAACPPADVPDAGFSDVGDDAVHGDAIDCVTWWEVALGFADNTYRPEQGVTRARMAAFVARLLEQGGAELTDGEDAFPDDDGSPQESEINQLASAGVVEGRDGRYAPDETVTRGQMATFLVRAQTLLDDGTEPPTGRDYFADDDDSVHEENINRAAGLGLTGGVEEDDFQPVETLTRGQMASFLARELDVATRYGFATPPSER